MSEWGYVSTNRVKTLYTLAGNEVNRIVPMEGMIENGK
jgi:hypothetical protein